MLNKSRNSLHTYKICLLLFVLQSALCYTMLHMCGHAILHNYSVIIFCDGETSEIFLTTRALIYADLMGDYCDSWKVFTWRSGAQCDWTTALAD